MSSRRKILVVDDQDSQRLALASILEDEGHEVLEAESGYQAIDTVKENSIDLVLMDIKMPGINGVQAFREIKKVSPQTTVVMMTGFAVEDLVQAALDEGAFSVIYKPFDVGKVIRLVESVIDSAIVLVVDDRSSDRETLSLILRERGFRVKEAEDGEQAVQMVGDSYYDVILMDVKMPGMDGFGAFEKIKEKEPGAKVLFITGFSDDDHVREALEAGAYPVTQKPFDIENLLSLVTQMSAEVTS